MKREKLVFALIACIVILAILLAVAFSLPGDDTHPPVDDTTEMDTGQTTTEEMEVTESGVTTVPDQPDETTAPPDVETTAPTQEDTSPEQTDPPETQEPTRQTDPPPETTQPPKQPDLVYSQFGRYSGAYVEDGSDVPVEDVAVVLVKNPTDQFLEFAQAEFDINGKAAVFVIRGLPPGGSAWVLEANKLTIESGSVFTLHDEVTSFSAFSAIRGVEVRLKPGSITATNTTQETLYNVYVYYRQIHTDGNFLGGITYRVSLGTLEPNTPTSATAGHCFPESCKIVKITYEKGSS